jgi:hypothetical protein
MALLPPDQRPGRFSFLVTILLFAGMMNARATASSARICRFARNQQFVHVGTCRLKANPGLGSGLTFYIYPFVAHSTRGLQARAQGKIVSRELKLLLFDLGRLL